MNTICSEGSIKGWAENILPSVRKLSPDTHACYSDPSRLQHYFHTAELLEGLVPTDRSLSEAGFLHGVREVSRLDKLGGDIRHDVKGVLEDRKRLWSVDKLDGEETAKLLPTLRHAGGAVLLLVEQLLHLDARGEFYEFTRLFPRDPFLPPASLVGTSTGFRDRASQLSYVRLVVIPTAEFFGLWFYRNLARNLFLFHEDCERFLSLAEFAVRRTQSGELDSRAEIVRGALKDIAGIDVFWEWHHVGTLDRLLAGAGYGEQWAQRLSNCGMVTVVCQQPEECYRVIASLHLNSEFIHQTRDIEDSLGNPKVSGYEAFHTVVTPKDSKAIRVRVTFSDAQRRRYSVLTQENLLSMKQLLAERHSNQLQVFASDGRPVLLPAGSTVLNFAYKIHSHLVALAKRATVNKEPVDLLHPLREGDVVQVEVGTEPILLPTDWEKKVPKETIPRIKGAHNHCYKPGLVSGGRAVLRERLQSLGVTNILNADVYSDPMLDSFLEEAVADLARKGSSPRGGVNSVLRHLKLGMSSDAESESQMFLIEKVIEKTSALIKASDQKEQLEGLSFPREMRGSFDQLVTCPRCQPLPDGTVVGKLEGRRLVIHSSRSECGTGGTLVDWKRQYTRRQYFVVEMINRKGIAADLLATVAKRGVDLVEHVGTSLGPSWAVLRLHTQSIGLDRVDEIAAELKRVEGVIRVFKPGERVVPVLEGPLPPRERHVFFGQALPYRSGPALEEDRYFYGRQEELARLRALFEQTRGDSSHGVMTLVQGPLKTGKSSLVKRFTREVSRKEYNCSVVFKTARHGEDWFSFSTRLREELVRELQPRLAQGYRILKELEQPGLEHHLKLFEGLERSLVLVIDEAALLFSNSPKGEQLMDLLRFITVIPEIAGLFVIWIGPEDTLSQIDPELILALRTAERLRLEGLELVDVSRLLRAENFDSGHVRISFDENVAKEVFRYTSGNAYWCSLLAEHLFKIKQSADEVVYTIGDLRKAKEKLRTDCVAFEDRVTNDFLSPELRRLVPVILLRLTQASGHTSKLTTAQLMRSVQPARMNVTDRQLFLILERLSARGAVRKFAEGRVLWAIGPPALAEHIPFCPSLR